MLALVARKLTSGQLAAARYARARRGDLGLSQQQLADKSHVSVGAIQKFEAGRTWPNPDTLSRIERLGLDLVVGRLTEFAHRHREQESSTLDDDIGAILQSNLNPDLKLRLIDRLRGVVADRVREETVEAERRLAELSTPGEGDGDQEIA